MNASEKLFVSLLGKAFDIRSDGSVWCLAQRGRTGRWRAIEPRRADELRADGYRHVRIQMDGKAHSIMAHRLVLLSAGVLIPAEHEGNHDNGQRGDNRLANLEVLTKSQNLAHAYRRLNRTRVVGSRNGRSVLTEIDIPVIAARLRSGESHQSIGNAYGVSKTAIGLIARGHAWRHAFPRTSA